MHIGIGFLFLAVSCWLAVYLMNGIYMCLSIEPIQKLLLGHLMGKYYDQQVGVSRIGLFIVCNGRDQSSTYLWVFSGQGVTLRLGMIIVELYY